MTTEGEAEIAHIDNEIQKQAKALYRSIYRKLYFKKYYEKNQSALRKSALENYHRSRGRTDMPTDTTEEEGEMETPQLIRIERRPITINLNLNTFHIRKEDHDG